MDERRCAGEGAWRWGAGCGSCKQADGERWVRGGVHAAGTSSQCRMATGFRWTSTQAPRQARCTRRHATRVVEFLPSLLAGRLLMSLHYSKGALTRSPSGRKGALTAVPPAAREGCSAAVPCASLPGRGFESQAPQQHHFALGGGGSAYCSPGARADIHRKINELLQVPAGSRTAAARARAVWPRQLHRVAAGHRRRPGDGALPGVRGARSEWD